MPGGRGRKRAGWGIHRREADALHAVWNANWDGLAHDQQRVDAVLASVDRVREATLALLSSLE